MQELKYIKLFENFMNIKFGKKMSKTLSNLKNKKINKTKEEFISNLDDLKYHIIDLSTSSKIGEIDINYYIDELKKNVDENILKILNVVNFLRIIKNIIKIPKKKRALKIETQFELYYETLDSRFIKLYDILDDLESVNQEDEDDEERSILRRKEFMIELKDLQVQLNRLQKWVKNNNKKVAILFEGRDSAGKGSTIKKITHYLPVNGYKIVTFGVPSKEEMQGDNWFKRYENKMPNEGEIVLFDRSYYGMGLVNPTMGYCTEEQYEYFMNNVNDFENKLNDDGVILIKFWFSITKEKQLQRFDIRKKSELKEWKFSENDMKSIEKWDLFTKYKERCFYLTSTNSNPWVIVTSNDKKLSSLNAIRYILNKVDYDNKDESLLNMYPDVVYELK